MSNDMVSNFALWKSILTYPLEDKEIKTNNTNKKLLEEFL